MLRKPGTRLVIGMLIALLAGACMMADDPQPQPKPTGEVSVEAHYNSLPDEPPVRAPDPLRKELPERPSGDPQN